MFFFILVFQKNVVSLQCNQKTKNTIMKEIKVYNIELAECIENKIDGICFIVSPEGDYVAHLFDEFYELHKEEIEKVIQKTEYCYCDYQVNEVDINKMYENVSN